MEYRYREQKELIKGELGNIPKSWNQAKAQYYFDVFAGGIYENCGCERPRRICA